MRLGSTPKSTDARLPVQKPAGLVGWLLSRLRRDPRPQPSLALLERISLAPRQTLSLVEAEGRRFLIATSAESTPAFYALDDFQSLHRRTPARARVS